MYRSDKSICYQWIIFGCMWSLLSFACDDQPSGLQPASPTAPSQLMDQGVSTGGNLGIPSTAGEAGGISPNMGGDTVIFCDNDLDCGELFCFQGRCVPEIPCDSSRSMSCPDGYVCVGGLCFEGAEMGGSIVTPTENELIFQPDRLRFTYNNAGDRSQNVAQLYNVSEQPLNLTQLRIEGSATFQLLNVPTLPLRLSPDNPLTLEVEYLANDPIADQATLVAITEEGAEARQALYSETKGAGAGPCLEVTPSQIFFGSVGRGTTALREVTLTSCGNRDVTVQGVRRGSTIFGALPQTFSIAPPQLPTALPPGQSIQFQVGYSPQRAGFEAGFIEVLSDDAQSPSQRVDLSAIAEPPPLQEIALHVRLEWDTDLTDVDLHLLGPNGQIWTCEGDCFFSNGAPNWGDQSSYLDDPFLDLDDVDGYGPENINLEQPTPGTYTVLVHYWADHGGQDPDARIEILHFGQVIDSFGPRALNQIDDVWEVAEIDFPSMAIRELGMMSRPPRTGLCGGF